MDVYEADLPNLLDLHDQMAEVAERRDTMSKAPWYWSDPECDHWAVGLKACVGDNGRIHYVRADAIGLVPACGRHASNVLPLEGPRVVGCRICCFIARENRDRIAQRFVQPIIKSHDRVNFISRERGRAEDAGS